MYKVRLNPEYVKATDAQVRYVGGVRLLVNWHTRPITGLQRSIMDKAEINGIKIAEYQEIKPKSGVSTDDFNKAMKPKKAKKEEVSE